ncbi:hypothetical protein BS50DRAFT_571700 [Corynespora cassiicola Philippines]|uniref:Uncharacterized protein n=1 Tax=Corynespora cassiicola Philippines TaxID=1448308 RepID=A0A2T2NYH7_CORCC|nr:hypothetical protein BS50DRAFT_571700 [Corynespora cassiicola Philippines]
MSRRLAPSVASSVPSGSAHPLATHCTQENQELTKHPSDYQCQGRNEPIWYPGYADMGWNWWDNRVSSYKCWYCDVGWLGCH